jgi:hypothetical protein
MQTYCLGCEKNRDADLEFCPNCTGPERYIAHFNTTAGMYYIYDTWKSEFVNIGDAVIRLNNLTRKIWNKN